ncbi:membrane-bound PQQ-dependent dehydrogenase, glucose/quinate/shikimate family [Stenotrophomonas sp. SY1]|uniref:membrane-bound PQQ-dependent dehydrogenase, glucose/quinate/shikimate family n=1 Tax=Stenotrophomonas sp. SY1 TaxID=477235 RepID=UPI001E3343B7|nr:membrane-bound PQQ-dependent dehydrogenase, glucose/quinate/shikimate family [Stenotrophomonas sp. SY1]MCD9085716.1 membrane-bound PQQ-dependent dehydrogenase, glucose/quinate/shikimate family [Stenotrophomonas sp. SY1]
MGVLLRLFAVLLGLIGVGLLLGGGWLVALKGSPYYLVAGAAYLLAAWWLWQRRRHGALVVAAVALLTIPWALWESGANYWALFPRLLAPLALAAVALWLMPRVADETRKQARMRRWGALGFSLLFAVGFVLAFVPHGVIRPGKDIAYTPPKGDNTPSDWSAYGRTPEGRRDAPFDQINLETVTQLEQAWSYRTGDLGPGVDQNTPQQIGDLLYSCSRNNIVSALDADTGALRWKYDPVVRAPFWQRCRGLGYYKLPAEALVIASADAADLADGAVAPAQACSERIIETTADARLIALDANTGKLCAGFGNGGTVQLSQGMGPVQRGFYFQTSAPLVARDLIVVGGWVVDNQMRDEPSGVIRAFSARTGQLVWAWDLGNPEITRLPPEGQTYTRGTPNMWTAAAYDDTLGLIYAPLGNATPDYYGQDRPPYSDEYNSSLVALDIQTGRPRWKFQTVHHDIWDYDLPSQPALIDLPDGKGGVQAAVLQTTKRGQVFLLDRATGKPLAEVAEKAVPQKGAVPEETLSPTQPYSVGMPTIGTEKLDERRMWGMTMFDQLACRIAFRRMRYDGDFTPPGLDMAIQHPGNIGGMNWGSVSVDSSNQRVFLNDIRVPSIFQLVPRAAFEQYAKLHPPVSDGHGPSPQAGTPYGVYTTIWFSKLGVPCVQPPFGTISALDLNTRRIAWQIPAGTASELGPMGVRLGLPMKLGMPSYGGTLSTAGGLVFFAGFQDYYLRAYDGRDGREVWKTPLPVGASATPMSYVSPKSGRQYIVVSVGGAAYSKNVGDYVIAFALPEQRK